MKRESDVSKARRARRAGAVQRPDVPARLRAPRERYREPLRTLQRGTLETVFRAPGGAGATSLVSSLPPFSFPSPSVPKTGKITLCRFPRSTRHVCQHLLPRRSPRPRPRHRGRGTAHPPAHLPGALAHRAQPPPPRKPRPATVRPPPLRSSPMPFVYRPSDIFSSGCAAIVNPVNCVGVMGAGLALAFKRRYPSHFSSYRAACRDRVLLPGTVHIDDLGEPASPAVHRRPAHQAPLARSLASRRCRTLTRRPRHRAPPPAHPVRRPFRSSAADSAGSLGPTSMLPSCAASPASPATGAVSSSSHRSGRPPPPPSRRHASPRKARPTTVRPPKETRE